MKLRLIVAAAAIALAGLAGCGVRGDPRLPEGFEDTVPFPGQYPAPELPPPAAEPENP